MSKIGPFLLCAAALLLAACGSTGSQSVRSTTSPAPATGSMSIEERLAGSANRVSESIRRLALTEQARTPARTPPSPELDSLPIELRSEITINWVGGAEELVQMLSAQIGYQFKTSGRRQANGNFVRVEKTKTPVFEILRDISLQMQGRAELIVDAQARQTEIRYAPR